MIMLQPQLAGLFVDSHRNRFPKVSRWEFFLTTPAATDLTVCEEKMLVKDHFTDWDCMVQNSAAAVKHQVIELLKQRFEC